MLYIRKSIFIVPLKLFIIIALYCCPSGISAQQFIPEGAKIAIITDLNRWITTCKGCQQLKAKYNHVQLTVISNTNKDTPPTNEDTYTVEYQDGKIRLRTCYDTYLSVCPDCRIDGPSFLLIAQERRNSSGKVAKEGLFDIVAVEGSCFYEIRTYNGAYLTRYHPKNRQHMLRGSQVVAGYYHSNDRRAGKFNIVMVQPGNIRPQRGSVSDAVQHSDVIGNKQVKYFNGRKWSLFQRSTIPNTTGALRTANVPPRFSQYQIEYLGREEGYIFKWYKDNLRLGVSLEKNGQLCHSKAAYWSERDNSALQTWNIEKKCDGYTIQNRGTGLYLGKTYINDDTYLGPVLEKDALVFYFEPFSSQESTKWKPIKVPGLPYEIIHMNSINVATSTSLMRRYINGEYTDNDGIKWRVATYDEAKAIILAIRNSECSLNVAFRYGILYYDSELWNLNTSIPKRPVIDNFNTLNKEVYFGGSAVQYQVILLRNR